MRKKLLWSNIVVILFISLTLGSAFFYTGQKYYREQTKKNAIVQVRLLKDLLEKASTFDAENFIQQYHEMVEGRITITDSQGVVIADSDVPWTQIENHQNREEIQQALKEGMGFSTRYSHTLQAYFLYTGISFQRQELSGVLRIAKPLTQTQQMNKDILQNLFLWILIGIGLSFFIVRMLASKILSPIHILTQGVQEVAQGNYHKKIYIESSEEIIPLKNAFNQMTEQLQNTILEIKDKNMKLEMVLNSIQTGIIAVDIQYRIILINPSCYSLLNIKKQEVQGDYFYDVIRDQTLWKTIETTMETGEIRTEEFSYSNQPDQMLKMDAYPILPPWSEGQLIGTLLVIQDITQLHKLEKLRSDFVSNVSHELKTPLTSIRGFIETLQEGALENPKVARRFLDIIDLEAERLYSLIQDILLLSEIENREQEQKYFYYEWIDIIQEVVQLLQPKVQRKGLDLVVDLSPSLPPFYCNKDRIKQMVINILDNAIHYTEKGAVGITCFFQQDQFYIQIWDTGIGIPQEHIPRLFERFYRVDKGRSRNKGGTGLGLSIVKHIVQSYDGTIQVESKWNEGSKFTIILPRIQGDS